MKTPARLAGSLTALALGATLAAGVAPLDSSALKIQDSKVVSVVDGARLTGIKVGVRLTQFDAGARLTGVKAGIKVGVRLTGYDAGARLTGVKAGI